MTFFSYQLEKAESYEERRVIRGQIRQVRKKSTAVSTTVSSHHKFVTSKQSQPTQPPKTPKKTSKVVESDLLKDKPATKPSKDLAPRKISKGSFKFAL